MQQRYYDPVAGRFLSVDPVVTNAKSGSHFNRYVYAENNPFKYVDPDGLDSVDIFGDPTVGIGDVCKTVCKNVKRDWRQVVFCGLLCLNNSRPPTPNPLPPPPVKPAPTIPKPQQPKPPEGAPPPPPGGSPNPPPPPPGSPPAPAPATPPSPPAPSPPPPPPPKPDSV